VSPDTAASRPGSGGPSRSQNVAPPIAAPGLGEKSLSASILRKRQPETIGNGPWHGSCSPESVVGKLPGRLLVVDDEAAIRFALSEYFRESGWAVDAAAEKEEAEALLACTEYAIVIADLRLTGIYGVEGLDIIEWSRHLRPETRVVLLTGNGTPEIEAEARRRGADAFLHKPLPLTQLEAVVDGLLRPQA
jgi:CheY-like chemotaxis protein